jgi:N-acyl-D-amino-acid deacylase
MILHIFEARVTPMSRSVIARLGTWLLMTRLLTLSVAQEPSHFELLLSNGTLIDGSGAEPKVADVGVTGGRILAVGELPENADMIVDCTGLIVCPGFIDLHTHSDAAIVDPKTAGNVNYLMQGCTSIITGNCGMGPVDVGKYLARVDAQKAGTHVGHLLPMGELRDQVVGKDDRPATNEEIEQMRTLAEQAMRDGAFGMSTGLIYVPGMFASTSELIEIAKVVGEHQGIYVSHIRGEGSNLLDSLQELLEIGKQAALPVHVSHFKASGKRSWGSLHLGIKRLEAARQAGQTVTADQYPYVASSTSLEATLLPDWARAGGRKELNKRLADVDTAARIRSEVAVSLASTNKIMIASCKSRREWAGKTIEQIAASEKREPVDIVLEIERQGGASVVNFSMSEEDVQLAMQLPWIATASDGGAKLPSGDRPHPRSFGTFPRKIGRYAIQQKLLTLPLAVRSATGLPADIIGLKDRGYLRPQMVADIAVFDPNTFLDLATFEEPFQGPTGLRYVFVAGVPSIYQGQATGALAGSALRKKLLQP